MTNLPRCCISILRKGLRRTNFALMLLCALTMIVLPMVQAQTFSVIHNFTGGGDGANPKASLTMDAAGSFYGTTYSGGTGYGVVFKLEESGSSWLVAPLYSFSGGSDGAHPYGRVTIAQDGTLYGTTYYGGDTSCACGTVFHLAPSLTAPKTALAPWNEAVILSFQLLYNGANPQGDLIFDRSGNIFGTTIDGGNSGGGVVYQLMPQGTGWFFSELPDRGQLRAPYGGVVFDSAGNLYGTSSAGGFGGIGFVYRLSRSGSGWTLQSLHQFQGPEGANPIGGLTVDGSGNLYGTTSDQGGGYGTVFEITSPGGNNWSFKKLYTFLTGESSGGPMDKLTMDAAGNLYSTTFYDGAYGYGSVFKLTPSNGGWTYTSLHDFTGSDDGAYPLSSVIVDASGNLYGTASAGGTQGHGVVWEIAP